ncbi:MAG: GNAT family protein [Ginsengibacter sp.]
MTKGDISLTVEYFLQSSPEFLQAMGVDLDKLPGKNAWCKIIVDDLDQPVTHKKFYYLIWQINDMPVGHSNINDIIFGEEAFMHIHLWNPVNRARGEGSYFIKESLRYYFQEFRLQKLYCQPYALNTAPNKALQNAGFEFIKKYETIPGWLNFNQFVNLWMMSRDNYYNQIKNPYG